MMLKLLTLVVATLAVSQAVPTNYGTLSIVEKKAMFVDFMSTFNKTYDSAAEMSRRFLVFSDSLQRIDELNTRDPSAVFGVTKFSDLTPEEFKFQRLLRRPIQRSPLQPEIAPVTSQVVAAPPSDVDWRKYVGKYMTEVRNQGQCGSCWAFSTAENIASVHAIAGKPLIESSVQQIVDCDQSDAGCNGGDPPTAYQYVMQAGGLESESEYPYTAQDGVCNFKSSKVKMDIKGWKFIVGSGENGENAINKMKTAVVNQPLSICVEADTWQYYTGGILSSNCGQQLDHCVILAGYHTKSAVSEVADKDYWIVRNSWGKDWGIEGYLYIETGKNLCGIQDEVTTAEA